MELWYACSEPERPPDPFVTWHYNWCVGCALKANGQVVRYPDDANVQRILGPIAKRLDDFCR